MPLSSLRLPGPAPRLPRRGRAGGFALPLALTAALVLLLAGLAAQSALHQTRLRNAATLGQRRLEDGLASAAHRLVGQVVARHPCLLGLPLEAWPQAGGDCADTAQLEALRWGDTPAPAYQLVAWRPAAVPPDSGARRLDLELVHRSEGGGPAWRAGFALEVLGEPPRVQRLRELGLRGALP